MRAVTLARILLELEIELASAQAKYPAWPDDLIHAVAILNEESGEVIRAALNHVYHDESIEHVRHELIQTGAMAIRCLLNLRR